MFIFLMALVIVGLLILGIGLMMNDRFLLGSISLLGAFGVLIGGLQLSTNICNIESRVVTDLYSGYNNTEIQGQFFWVLDISKK